MFSLLVVSVLAQGLEYTPDSYPMNRFSRLDRFGSSMSSDAGAPYSYAWFEFAPPTGAGMPAECSDGGVFGFVDAGEAAVALTFTRASAAECPSGDGQTWTQLAAGTPRVTSGTAASSVLGLLAEKAATNLLLYSRDLSQAAWTKTNMTCALTATGMRGAANSASTCTATAPNATVCQTVTATSSRATSWHLKRRTGTGAVELSRDGAAYLSSISASLSGLAWRRAVPSETSGCMGGNCIVLTGLTSSATNPTLCLRLATSGDAVDIDFVQDEVGLASTSPILTTAASASRNSDVAYVTIPSATLVSLRAWADSGSNKNQYGGMMAAWQSASVRTWLDQGMTPPSQDQYMQCYFRTGTDYVANSYYMFNTTFRGAMPFQCDFSGGNGIARIHGAQYSTALAYTPQSYTRIYIGGLEVDGNQWNGVVSRVCGHTTAGGCTKDWVTGSTDVAMLGDSLTRADTTGAPRPPYTVALTTSRNVVNLGVPGNTAAQCRTRFDESISGKGYGTLVVLCSVNSLNNGLTAAATWADLEYIAETARNQGVQVRLVDTLPWATYASWSTGKGAEDDTLRATMLAYCAAHPSQVQCVDTDSLGTGSPLALQAGYDYSDHLHLNAAGNTAFSALVSAVIP